MQKLLFRTFLVNIFNLVSEVEHDVWHWPLKEKHVYLKWRQETAWGQLFDRYCREGHIGA
jgi:hypothetical protein